ncbi:hypothetical protein R6Z07F_012930 [Ovis aries]
MTGNAGFLRTTFSSVGPPDLSRYGPSSRRATKKAPSSDASSGRQRRRLPLETCPPARPLAQPCPARGGRRRRRGRTNGGGSAMQMH